jgi:hypothetical protein
MAQFQKKAPKNQAAYRQIFGHGGKDIHRHLLPSARP